MNRDRSGSIIVLLLADSHLGFDTPQRPRVARRRRGEEFYANYLRALDTARRHPVDLVVHGGDLFYRSRIPDTLVSRAFKPLLDLADSGIPVYLVPGNHERSRISTTLFELHPNIHIFDRPRTYGLRIRSRMVTLSGFPSCRNGIRDTFTGLLHQTSFRNHEADLRLLCVHQSVEGAQVGVHNYTFRNGPDVIPGRLLPTEIDAVLAGHIHRCQCLTHDTGGEILSAPVLYPGSIERTSFAERLEPKGFFLLEFSFPDSAPRPVLSHAFHPLPCRPMFDLPLDAVKLDGSGGETVLRELLSTLDPNGIVRLSIRGELSAQAADLLRAQRLRRLAPPTMNVTINWGSIRQWNG